MRQKADVYIFLRHIFFAILLHFNRIFWELIYVHLLNNRSFTRDQFQSSIRKNSQIKTLLISERNWNIYFHARKIFFLLTLHYISEKKDIRTYKLYNSKRSRVYWYFSDFILIYASSLVFSSCTWLKKKKRDCQI